MPGWEGWVCIYPGCQCPIPDAEIRRINEIATAQTTEGMERSRSFKTSPKAETLDANGLANKTI